MKTCELGSWSDPGSALRFNRLLGVGSEQLAAGFVGLRAPLLRENTQNPIAVHAEDDCHAGESGGQGGDEDTAGSGIEVCEHG